MELNEFQKLLQVTANKMGIGKTFSAIQVCHEVNKVLSEMFGEDAVREQKVRAASFENGTLKIESLNAGWKQNLQMKKHEILEKVRKLGVVRIRI